MTPTEIKACAEAGCPNTPGGRWSPFWCPQHDLERMERITRNLDQMAAEMGLDPASPSKKAPL